MAGVIKMVMAMRHGVLPKTLHVDEPSRNVDWSTGGVSLLVDEAPWEGGDGRRRRAGVSSFGISGTNAHVILRSPRWLSGSWGMLRVAGVLPFVVSGKSRSALCAQAGRLCEFVEGSPGVGVADVGLSLAGRAVFGRRAVVLAGWARGSGLRSLLCWLMGRVL